VSDIVAIRAVSDCNKLQNRSQFNEV